MPRKHLSPTSIPAFKPTTEGFLWDNVAPRLAVRARSSGAKTFIFKGTLNYRDIRVTIGSVESCPIDADRVRVWLKDEALRRPTQANHAFVRLRAFLNWCPDRPEYRGQAHADACITRTARDELPKKIAKDDCLQREQLPAWFAAVARFGIPSSLPICKLRC